MKMRMPTLLPFGEGCMSGEAIDTRTRSIRRGSGHGTLWRLVTTGEVPDGVELRPAA